MAIDSERWDVQDFIHLLAWPGNRNARFLCAWPLLSRRGEVSTPKGAAVSRPVSGSHGMLEGSHVPIQDNSPKKMLGGGNSNIFYVQPDPWGNDQI